VDDSFSSVILQSRQQDWALIIWTKQTPVDALQISHPISTTRIN
jgi:hypothetical protein